MMDFTEFNRYCRTGKHKLPVFIPMVYFKPNSIPELWKFLPFVNQTGNFTLKQITYVGFSHLPILMLFGGIIHIYNTFCMLLSSCRLATSFRSFYQYSTHRF